MDGRTDGYPTDGATPAGCSGQTAFITIAALHFQVHTHEPV